MPTSGGLGKAVRNSKEIGCAAVQVFTSSPQQWKAKVVTDEMVADLTKAREETGIDCLISHDSYLIHVSAVDDEHRAKSIAGLQGEIERCHRYGIPFVVSHMGGYKDQTVEEGLNRMVESTKHILAQMPPDVTLCMETTAGQGTALNSSASSAAKRPSPQPSPRKSGARERQNTFAPEGAQRCRALASGLKGRAAGRKEHLSENSGG